MNLLSAVLFIQFSAIGMGKDTIDPKKSINEARTNTIWSLQGPYTVDKLRQFYGSQNLAIDLTCSDIETNVNSYEKESVKQYYLSGVYGFITIIAGIITLRSLRSPSNENNKIVAQLGTWGSLIFGILSMKRWDKAVQNIESKKFVLNRKLEIENQQKTLNESQFKIGETNKIVSLTDVMKFDGDTQFTYVPYKVDRKAITK